MSSTAIQLPENFEEAERFQRLFVTPVVVAMEAKLEGILAPLVASQQAVVVRMETAEGRIGKLEASEKHALWGWGAYATVVAAVTTGGIKWLMSKLHL